MLARLWQKAAGLPFIVGYHRDNVCGVLGKTLLSLLPLPFSLTRPGLCVASQFTRLCSSQSTSVPCGARLGTTGSRCLPGLAERLDCCEPTRTIASIAGLPSCPLAL